MISREVYKVGNTGNHQNEEEEKGDPNGSALREFFSTTELYKFMQNETSTLSSILINRKITCSSSYKEMI